MTLKLVEVQKLKIKSHYVPVTLLVLCLFIGLNAYALDGVEVHTGQLVVLLELLNPGGLAVGREIRIALGDTGEVMDVVIVSLRPLGTELEIEVINRESNQYILFEVPADGISELRY